MNKTCIRFLKYLGISTVFLLIFARTTSPLYCIYGTDSEVFKLMGALMHQGKIPYVDFFDHKGPVLMFLMYISYGMIRNNISLLVLEVIFLTITLWGVDSTLNLFDCGKKKKIISFIGVLIGCSMYFDRGNTVAEYCLPFLMWAQYFAIKYIKNEEEKKVFPYALFFGIAFAVCTYTRLTNAVPLCAEILVILLTISAKKQWKRLLKAFLGFIAGFAVISIPIFIFFYLVGAIPEMVYCTFIYNFRYLVINKSTYHYTMREVIEWMLLFISPFVISCIAGIANYKKYNQISMMLIIQTGLAIGLQSGSALYEHYLLVYVPVILLGIIFLDTKKIVNKIVLGIMVVSLFAGAGWGCWKCYDAKIHSDKQKTEEYYEMADEIDEEDRNKVIVYNSDCSFYNVTKINPCYKFVHLQDFQCQMDLKLYGELQEQLKSLKAKYIIKRTEKKDLPEIKEIIEPNYKEIKRTKKHILLKRID